MSERVIAAAWLLCPTHAYRSTHPDKETFTCWDVMVAQGVVFLPEVDRAALRTFDWLGRDDAAMDWHDTQFLEQVMSRLKECARDATATTPCLYKL